MQLKLTNYYLSQFHHSPDVNEYNLDRKLSSAASTSVADVAEIDIVRMTRLEMMVTMFMVMVGISLTV